MSMTLLSEEMELLKKAVLERNGSTGGTGEEAEPVEQKPHILITYSFLGKPRSKKMLINYELVGRNGKDGLLQKLGGKRLVSGCIIVPEENEGKIECFLSAHEVAHSKQKVILPGGL